MIRTAITALVLLTAHLIGAPALAAIDEDDLLPIEEAFALSASVDPDGQLRLQWRIAEGYYLYRHRMGLATTQDDVVAGDLVLPAGEQFHDEFFGDVETYRGLLDASARLDWPAGLASAELDVRYQGCADLGICYPPHRELVSVALPAQPTSAPALRDEPLPGLRETNGSIQAIDSNPLSQLLGGGQDPAPLQDGAPAGREPPLPEEQAFVFEAIAWSPTEILARFTMPPNYYLYRDATNFALLSDDGGEWQLGAPAWPEARAHTDDHFGAVSVYFDMVEVPITVAPGHAGQTGTLTVVAQFQGCQLDGICYPPMTRPVSVEMPPADQAQTQSAQAHVARNPYVATALEDPGETGAATADGGVSAGVGVTETLPPSTLGILGALLLALLGGVILNLMPCVLPILSLKVLGVAQSGESATKARRHALWYTAGVLVSFAAVGLLVIALRGAGQALGWGFQLQQPLFVTALVYVMFAIGLMLSGVFNIGAGLVGAGQGLTSRSGPAGDFFTGVLAVVVASPCTVPFMGPAVAFAFASSSMMALLVFLALGLGLALPFLLIGLVPALASRLPRPGAWMETLKQFLAFPMYLTAIWLVWVLGKQRGVDAVALALVGATVLALGLWWWERNRYGSSPARAIAIVLMLVSLLPLYRIVGLEPPIRAAETRQGSAIPYSAERLASLRAEGRGVFVDMTADWCVTCKMNERTVIDTDRFRGLLEQRDTVLMVGDWTNVDPHISDFLKDYDSPGVPLYVVFRPGVDGPGLKLPTVLTHGIVEDALAP